jgi:hypothetical protein
MGPVRRTIPPLACAAALTGALGATTALAPAATGVDPALADADARERKVAAEQRAGAAAGSPERYRSAYRRWRKRLLRNDVFAGRNLLPDVRAADGSARAPIASDLRRSIWRMQRRWRRWLRTTVPGKAVAFRLKVRASVPRWGRAHLRSIARCESHGNPRAVGGGGVYRGMYQFSFSTWRVVGGRGDPAAASRWEQTWRAWRLLSRHGAGHWPVCG